MRRRRGVQAEPEREVDRGEVGEPDQAGDPGERGTGLGPKLGDEDASVARRVLLAAVSLAVSCGVALCDPPSLILNSAVYDSQQQRMLVFGGTPGLPAAQAFSNTCWSLAL